MVSVNPVSAKKILGRLGKCKTSCNDPMGYDMLTGQFVRCPSANLNNVNKGSQYHG